MENLTLKSLIEEIENPKIFITGLSATGKTFLANKISTMFNIEFYNYDDHWDYFNSDIENNTITMLNNLPNTFVIDGIPPSSKYKNFKKYKEENKNVLVICVYQSNINEWIKNIINKPYFNIKKGTNNYINNYIEHNYYDDWLSFYEETINYIKPTFFYDNSLNEIIMPEKFKIIREEIFKTLTNLKNKNQSIFKDYLDTLIYDKYYQDIEFIDFLGYSKSFETWNRIKDLIDWKGKSVIDLGCFHGYFSFKAEQARATNITGLDISETVLKTANMIKKIIKSKVNFLQWSGDEKTPKSDVALVLNVLHHAANEEKTLQNINAKIAIFEVNQDQIPLIKKYFTITKNVSSHRVINGVDRRILLGEKI